MSRLLLLLSLAVIAYFTYQRLLTKRPSQPEKKAIQSQNIVRCEHCGIHLPDNESLAEAGRHYCSAEHLKSDRMRNG